MKDSLKNIKIAFILNLFFSIFELVGGILTNSISIVSDAIHDFGDAISIAISIILEKKSLKQPDDKYTYGYLRYSVFGALVTSTILLCGSILVIYNAIYRILNPVEVNYDGMIIFAIVGVLVNFIATYKTSGSKNLNEKAVSLHMLEDVFGWCLVLVGSIIIKLFDISIIDPILSIIISLFMIINVSKNLLSIFNIFLEKAPDGINIIQLKKHLMNVENVIDVHHIHIWTMDGVNNYATIHVLVGENNTLSQVEQIKKQLKEELSEHSILHSTIEFEINKCNEANCKNKKTKKVEIHNHTH